MTITADLDNKLTDVFNAFTLGRLQDAIKVWRLAEEHQISRKELAFYVKSHISLNQSAAEDPKNSVYFRRCPQCGSKAIIRPVNIPQGKRNVYGYRSYWVCWFCMWEEFSTNHPADEIRKYPVSEND